VDLGADLGDQLFALLACSERRVDCFTLETAAVPQEEKVEQRFRRDVGLYSG
jgi:hypothetical protein